MMPLPSANFSSHGRGRWHGFGAQYEPVSAGKAGIRRCVERDAAVVFPKFLLRVLFIVAGSGLWKFSRFNSLHIFAFPINPRKLAQPPKKMRPASSRPNPWNRG